MAQGKNGNILLVEDDDNLGFILKDYLELEGYSVHLEKNGAKGLDAFRKRNIDLCILDVMMPIKDGFTLGQEIRELNKEVPIVFLTAKSMEMDRIKGLKIGADDYITKPFCTEELVLRIKAILARYWKGNAKKEKPAIKEVYPLGNYSFNYSNQKLTGPDGERGLTKKEAEVLCLLCSNMGKLVRREDALKSIWGEDDYFMGRSMDVYITKLRKYLKDDVRVSITNVHGTGFLLEIKCQN